MKQATRLIALAHALAEAKARVREVGAPNSGRRVELYQRADTLPGEHYAWCQAFQNAMWRLSSGGRIVFGDNIVGGETLANGTASVGLFVVWARNSAKADIVDRPYRGDHFAMQLTSDSWPDHVGQIARVLSFGPAGYLCRTVEGNTSSGEAGSQDEGDGVYVRTRWLRPSRTVFVRVKGTRDVETRTPATVLRRKRGYWSWLQWRLGEGAWKGYGLSNPDARPDVPRRISRAWWRMAARFTALRK